MDECKIFGSFFVRDRLETFIVLFLHTFFHTFFFVIDLHFLMPFSAWLSTKSRIFHVRSLNKYLLKFSTFFLSFVLFLFIKFIFIFAVEIVCELPVKMTALVLNKPLNEKINERWLNSKTRSEQQEIAVLRDRRRYKKPGKAQEKSNTAYNNMESK